MNLILTPGARADLVEAARWYAEQQVGLDIRFAFAVEIALRRVESAPTAYGFFYGPYRRMRVRPFAYSILYEMRGESVIVVAVIHVRRGPEQIDRHLRRPL